MAQSSRTKVKNYNADKYNIRNGDFMNQETIKQIPENINQIPKLSAIRYAFIFKALKQQGFHEAQFNEQDFLTLPTFQDQLNYLRNCATLFGQKNDAEFSACMSAIHYGISLIEKNQNKNFNIHYTEIVNVSKKPLKDKL